MTFLYMMLVIGVPFSGIIVIYISIVRFTRRTNVTSAVVSNALSVSKRNLYVLKHTLTLIGILGTAGIPSTVVIIWNAISPGQVPVPFYLACVLNVSLCNKARRRRCQSLLRADLTPLFIDKMKIICTLMHRLTLRTQAR